MAFSELSKTFKRIRVYLRDYYVYGFKHTREYNEKSSRSHSYERKRLESWLKDYMTFRDDREGRITFLSVDSRQIPRNPLYQAFRTRSFTDLFITLHFHVLDMLDTLGPLSMNRIMDCLYDRLGTFPSAKYPDSTTVGKKLNEYVQLGLLSREKHGKEYVYSIHRDSVPLNKWNEAAAFFSEVAPLGVIGSYVLDRIPQAFSRFRFKHHYILNTLDSEIICTILTAMQQRKSVIFPGHGTNTGKDLNVLPLKLYIGTQTGRQYMLAWVPATDDFHFYRTDLMDEARIGTEKEAFAIPDGLEERLKNFCAHVWGVSGNDLLQTTHIEMTVLVRAGEAFIVERLQREKRCGKVVQVDETRWRFTADVYDVREMIPWLRTFIGRIADLQCSDERVIREFWDGVADMATLYGEEEEHAVP